MLRCPTCGNEFEDRWRCPCGAPLDIAERPLPDGPPAVDAREGLWAFDAFLPVERRVSLGEGFTPLVSAPDWDATFKLEYVSPTGSFKDRGATTTLSQAVELDVERVVEDSSGNAGAAIATYAARAGIDATIYVPASVTESKVRAIERARAEVVRVDGSREAVTDACIEAVEADEGWYASHAWNPYFFEGTATFAYEVAAQRDWSVPDAVVCPLGHGTLFLGAYRGFSALCEAGWTDRVPRLLGAQAAGYAPVTDELRGESVLDRQSEHGDSVQGGTSGSSGRASGGDRAAGRELDQNDLADGIQIRDPVRHEEILTAVRETDGDAIAVDQESTRRELDALRAAGFYVEPTCAVAPAALRGYRERGVLALGDDVVVPLTGSGLKT